LAGLQHLPLENDNVILRQKPIPTASHIPSLLEPDPVLICSLTGAAFRRTRTCYCRLSDCSRKRRTRRGKDNSF